MVAVYVASIGIIWNKHKEKQMSEQNLPKFTYTSEVCGL